MENTNAKPDLTFAQIWNMSFGFMGIQFGFALQNGNASGILMTFGADIHQLGWFWLVAPITGMFIQPIVGYMSDRTWCRLGRRRPYFLLGAILTSLALVLMPNAPHLNSWLSPMLVGGGLLMLMDASINISMEPFRALVADKLPKHQHTMGFSVQTVLIGLGAVIGSWLPYMLGNWFGVNKTPKFQGHIANNVVYSFYIGAAVLLLAMLWTIITTKEDRNILRNEIETRPVDFHWFSSKILFLVLVQFFSWFALFTMWVYTTPAVALKYFGTINPSTSGFQNARDWVGILFGVYNGVSAIFAFLIPYINRKISRKYLHATLLLVGSISMFSFLVIDDYRLLILPMIGIGMVWAGILALPYAILANLIPSSKMGLYMGFFNMTITIPQIISGVFSGLILKYLFDANPLYCIVSAGFSFVLASIASLVIVDDEALK